MSNTKTKPNDSVGNLTKREHFAAMAMQAICSQKETWQQYSNAIIADDAVKMADALIEQLNKQNT